MILSLDTSTAVCSVALHDGTQLIAEQNYFLGRSHSSLIPTTIDQMLSNCGVDKTKITAVAISGGPGSYTGLRIGTSSAKGLCYALDIPLIAVNTLEGLAQRARPYNINSNLLCPMLDARRMEVYMMVLDPDGEIIRATEAVVLEEDTFEKWSDKSILLFGNGAEKSKVIYSAMDNISYLDQIHPSAKAIGELAIKKYENANFEDLAYYEPFYLKAFKAIKPKPLV